MSAEQPPRGKALGVVYTPILLALCIFLAIDGLDCVVNKGQPRPNSWLPWPAVTKERKISGKGGGGLGISHGAPTVGLGVAELSAVLGILCGIWWYWSDSEVAQHLTVVLAIVVGGALLFAGVLSFAM